MDDCESFMIAMCKPGTGLTVSTLLDYILAGEKYDLTRFLETAVEFCSHINFHLLNGKSIQEKNVSILKYGNVYQNHLTLEEIILDQNIFWKFSKIELKTQFAIAKKRVQLLEMNTMKRKRSLPEEHDNSIRIF